MKTLVIIVGFLAITTAVYGKNIPRLKMFIDNLGKCSEQFGGTAAEPSAETLICAQEKDGQIFDANGQYIKDAVLNAVDDSISDSARLEKARGIFNNCYNDGIQSGSTGRELTMKIAACHLSLIPLLDKP